MASVATQPSAPHMLSSVRSQDSPVDHAIQRSRLDQAKLNAIGASSPPHESFFDRKKRKPETAGQSFRTWLLNNQIGVCANLLIIHALAHALLPRARAVTAPFFQLSYHNPATGNYARGPEDGYFVVYWLVALLGLRAACMEYVLEPMARLGGVTKKRTQLRFAEQGWLVIYCTCSVSIGTYIAYNSTYWMNMRALWKGFPLIEMTGLFKWYYLVQFAFWLQQLVTIHMEERRKDHWQMFSHHIVTLLLIISSYGYYQTNVGNIIMVLMDAVDIALAIAKNLKYCGFQTVCDAMFGVFIVSWFLLRHVLYLMICWSVNFDIPREMTYGCYSSATGEYLSLLKEGSSQPGGTETISELTKTYYAPGATVCYNWKIRYAFLSLLLALQGITVVWFVMIIRVAYRVLKGDGAAEPRSDDEDEEEEAADIVVTESAIKQEKRPASVAVPLEEEVGVEGLSFTRKSSTAAVRSRKPGAASSSLATISDKKDILNRIGCDTKSTQ